jgi:hypothetical protein
MSATTSSMVAPDISDWFGLRLRAAGVFGLVGVLVFAFGRGVGRVAAPLPRELAGGGGHVGAL